MEIITVLKKVKEIEDATALYDILKELNIKDSNYLASFKKFLKTTIVIIKNPQFKSFENFIQKTKKFVNIKNDSKNLSYIIKTHLEENSKKDLVEIKGIENNSLHANNFNISLKILMSDNFEILKQKVGEEIFKIFLKDTCLLIKENNFFIQVNGTPLSKYFNHKNMIKNYESKIKKPFKKSSTNILLDQTVDRNIFMYCLHSNKSVDFFHKSFLYQKKKSILNSNQINKNNKLKQKFINKKIIEYDYINELYELIFKKISVNKKTKTELNRILKKIINNYLKLNMDKLFRKTCNVDFKKYTKCKKELKNIKNQLKSSNFSKDDISAKFQENFSKLTEMSVHEDNVYLFLKRVTKKIFPIEFFGLDNIKVINNYIKKIVFMKRFESFTYREIYENLKTKNIKWFKREFHPLFIKEIRAKRKNIIVLILIYFFEQIILLIKCNFYVTEKHNRHNKLFYYPMSVWYLISQLGTLQMEVQNLDRILEKSKLSYMKESPIAKLRFVPKNDSLRPIMTFYRKFKDANSRKLVRAKNYLHPVKIVLRSVKQSLFEGPGFAVFDNHQIFKRLEEFVKKWKRKNMPELFSSCLDIKKCYDSVNLYKMFEFLKNDDIVEQIYLINNFFKIMRNKRYHFNKAEEEKVKISNMFLGKRRDTSNTMEELCSLQTYFKDKILLPNNTIFIDNGQKYLYTKKEIKEKVEFVCNKVFVKFGKSYFKLNRGLPQGLSVSAVLSSYYYSKLEEKATREFIDKMELKGVLFLVLRLTDDYLIISEDKKFITEFYDLLSKSSKENNYKFNTKKLKSSFRIKGFQTQSDITNFKWIGKIFDLKKMEIKHTQILNQKEAFYTVNINFPLETKMIPDFLKGKFKTFLLNQNTFYFSTSINSDSKIEEILPLIINSAFLKLNPYLNTLGDDLKYKRIVNQKFGAKIAYKIIETIKDCAHHICQARKLKQVFIEKIIRGIIVEKLKKVCNNKLKFYILKQMCK